MYVWMYGCMDVCMYGQMNGWMYGCMDVCMYDLVWYCVVLYSIVQYCMVLRGIVGYCVVLYGIVQYSFVWYQISRRFKQGDGSTRVIHMLSWSNSHLSSTLLQILPCLIMFIYCVCQLHPCSLLTNNVPQGKDRRPSSLVPFIITSPKAKGCGSPPPSPNQSGT